MSSRSKYPSKKVLVPAALIVALVITGLGVTSIAAGQVATTPIQNNIIAISTSQPNSSNDASDYFVLQSQQELFNAVKTGQAEESLPG